MAYLYELSLDPEALCKQRELLLQFPAAKFLSEENIELFEGVIYLLAEIADQAHDRHGLPTLLVDGEGEDAD